MVGFLYLRLKSTQFELALLHEPQLKEFIMRNILLSFTLLAASSSFALSTKVDDTKMLNPKIKLGVLANTNSYTIYRSQRLGEGGLKEKK